MGDLKLIASFIPEQAYKYIVLGLIGLLIFRSKIPILNKIDVRFHFPEEFMRSFRWITPTIVFINVIMQIFILLRLREVLLILKAGG